MTMSYASSTYACTCDNDYTKLGVEAIGHQSCVHTTKAAPYLAIESTATQVTYSTGTIVSQTFLHYFTKAAANCAYYGSSLNVLDCQVLANLCVLQLYYDQSGACKSFNAIVALRGTSYTESVINWGTGMPWLYYSGGNTACSDTGYRPYVSLKNYVMNYAVAQYSMNGTFFGFTQLSTLLTYCTRRAPHTGKGGGSSSSTGWNKFGATEQSKFACDLDTLTAANGKQQMFYELYLYDNQYVDLYYPVPVRIVNLKSGDVTVNSLSPKAPCGGNDILVRRFFLFDIVSGLTSASATVPQVMRFASDITLEVQISDNFRKIKAPILTIQYQESIPATWAAYIPTNDEGSIGGPQTVNYYFQARYSMNMDSFSSTLFGFFIAVVVFCGLCFLFRLNNWNVRMSRMVKQGYNMSNGINLRSMFEFTLLSTSSWVYFFFPVHLITCWYFFAFFKLQSVPATLLPPMNNIYSTSSPYFVFVANLHIMAFFQLFYCITLIYRQATADIFFLDWQPPSAPTGGGKGQPQTAGKVSVWRTLFVANEWAELQTKRKTDVAFSLFWIGFFLLGLGLEYNATQQPDLTNQSMGTLNVVLRFANTSWWWFVMSLFQFFWKFLFWERFIDESPEQQFIDFCTIAKVSILVLDEPYHGYYLHCRSPHQNADSSMAELVEMLHKEEAGLTVDRSLEGGPKDVQTFRIFMSGEWRARFNNIYSKLAKTESAFEMFTQGRSARRANGGATPLARLGGAGDGSINDSKNSTTAWLRVSSFLQEFVENSLNTPGKTTTHSCYSLRTDTSSLDISDTSPPPSPLTTRFTRPAPNHPRSNLLRALCRRCPGNGVTRPAMCIPARSLLRVLEDAFLRSRNRPSADERPGLFAVRPVV